MAKKNKYTDAERAAAIIWLETAGYPNQKGALSRVAKEARIPHQTLRRWFWEQQNPAPPDLVQEKRREMREVLTDILYGFSDEVLRRVQTNELADAPLNQLMQGLGITFDKLQLTEDKPTVIMKLRRAIESGKVTPEQVAQRYPTLAQQLFESVGADVVSDEANG